MFLHQYVITRRAYCHLALFHLFCFTFKPCAISFIPDSFTVICVVTFIVSLVKETYGQCHEVSSDQIDRLNIPCDSHNDIQRQSYGEWQSDLVRYLNSTLRLARHLQHRFVVSTLWQTLQIRKLFYKIKYKASLSLSNMFYNVLTLTV